MVHGQLSVDALKKYRVALGSMEAMQVARSAVLGSHRSVLVTILILKLSWGNKVWKVPIGAKRLEERWFGLDIN